MPIPGLGWHNPLPADVGGGPTETEELYEELRKAIGEGAAGPYEGIEDLWRICKAQGLAAAATVEERAALQFLPSEATDHVPVYEDLLDVAPADTLVERQAAITYAWTLALSAVVPSLRAELQRISPQLDYVIVDPLQSTVCQFGKQFAPRTGGPSYGDLAAAPYPNFSTHFVVLVRYTLGVGQTQIPIETRTAVARYLNEVLSSWVDWSLFTGTPFYLDGGPDGTSLLDQTGFG